MSSSHEILLASSPDGPITAYDIASGTILSHFTCSRSPRRGLAFAGKDLIAASHVSSTTASGSIHLYSWCSSTALHQLHVPEPVAPLAATSDGFYLFTGGLSGNIHALSLPSGYILNSFSVHNKSVSCLRVSNDGSLLISGGDDGDMVVISIFHFLDALADENSRSFILHRFAAHTASVTAITSCLGSSNHPTIISCSMDCTCKLWSLLDGTNLWTMTFPCPISGLALDPTETNLYAAGSDGLIYKGTLKVGSKQEVSQGHEIITWAEKHGGAVVSVVMVNDGKNLVSATEDGSVYVWEVEKGQIITVLGCELGRISDVVVTSGIDDGTRACNCRNESGVEGVGLPAKELSRSVNEITEVEDELTVAEKDRNRAIDILDSAISIYERLLELAMKETERDNSNNSSE